MIVRNLKIREIFTTTSEKTIEIELETDKVYVRSSVPMGTSRSRYEVRYLPTDVAIRRFAILRRNFRTQSFNSQKEVDDFLHTIDKSVSFREIGGNLALALSSVFLKAFAAEVGVELWEYVASVVKRKKLEIPKPLCNIVGGWHRKSIQEFLLLPVHQSSFLSSVEKITEAYKEIGEKLEQIDKSFRYGKNIESAWVTALPIEKILSLLKDVADKRMLKIGIDVAASQLWDGKFYVYQRDKNGVYERMTRPEQTAFISDIAERYPIAYIEDPFHEDDFLGFAILTQRLSEKLIVGDDLYATNIKRLQKGIIHKSTNAVIVKPNQIGTITDTMNFVAEAQKHKWKIVMSHRSSETEDTLICHLAVGLGCDYVKFGISGERVAKINEMIRIEERLKANL